MYSHHWYRQGFWKRQEHQVLISVTFLRLVTLLSTAVFFNVQASVKFLICISVALLYYIFRKYDEVVSINDIPVSESDQNLVKSLLDGAVTTLNMVRLELLVISFANTPFFLILIYMSIKGDWRRSHQKAWVHYAVNSTSIPDFILAIICLYSLFLFIGSQATGWQLSG